MLTIINRHHKEPYDIYAGRPSILGNPFSHLPKTAAKYRVKDRDEAVRCYEEWAWQRMQQDVAFRLAILACEGQRVACWCHPLNCHVNAISRLIVRWKAEHP